MPRVLRSPGCSGPQGSPVPGVLWSSGCIGPQDAPVPEVLQFLLEEAAETKGGLLAPVQCWVSSHGCLSTAFPTPVSILLRGILCTDSFLTGSPLSRGPLMWCHFSLLLIAAEFACSLGGPGPLCPPIPTPVDTSVLNQARCRPQVRSLARTDEARGLLWLLEEEALQPGGNEDTLLERLFSYYGPQEGGKKGQAGPGTMGPCVGKAPVPCPSVPFVPTGHNPLLPSDKPRHFLLGHSSGTNWVEYDATGWLNHVKHNPASQNASVLLQESQK